MSKWNDVEQKLPPKKGEYLVAFYHLGFTNGDPYVSSCVYNPPGYAKTTWCDTEGNSWDDLVITHWMPLPAPPETKPISVTHDYKSPEGSTNK